MEWNRIRLSNAHGHRIFRVIFSLSRMPTFHRVIGIASSLSCYPWHGSLLTMGPPHTLNSPMHFGMQVWNWIFLPMPQKLIPNFPETSIVPGVQVATCKSVGRTLSAGCISGGIPYINQDALKLLAFRTLHGRSQFLRDWGVPFWCLTSHLVSSGREF